MSFSDPRELALTPSGAPRGLGADDAQRGDTIFIADASVEGEEVSNMLRGRGFNVVDVPFALLDAQILASPPRVLVLDVDQPRAVALAQNALSSPICSRMALFCIGDPIRADEIFVGKSGAQVSGENVFERPVDIQRLVERVCAVAVPSGQALPPRGTTPPPQHGSRHSLLPPSSDSSPPLAELADGAVDALDVDAFLPSLDDGGVGLREALSPDLLAVLDAAEARVAAVAERAIGGPISEEDPDCPVPPEMLAPLDEPLDALDESPGTGSGHSEVGSEGTGSIVGAADGSVAGVRSAAGPAPASSGGGVAPAPSSSGAGALPKPNLDTAQRLSALYGDGAPDSAAGAASQMGYPFSMLSPFGVTAMPATPHAVTSRRLEVPTGDREAEARGEDAPVRFQEAKPVAEGRSAMARVFEDRARAEPPPPTSAQRDVPTGRPPPMRGQQAPSERRGPASELPVRLPPSSGDHASPLAQSSALGPAPSTGTLTDRALSVTDTSPRTRGVGSGTFSLGPDLSSRLEPMRYAGRKGEPASRAAAVDAVQAPITAGSARSTGDAGMPMVFAELEGARPLARAIASRFTGAIALIVDGLARRIMLQDGDVVTAVSDRPDESLVAFLGERGDIDREVLPKLQSRLPVSGRHAGAALIAQGYLAQDDLWPILRAHAEWIIGRAIAHGPGGVELDEDPPQRLRAEPSVFGGGTGAEIFVELMRRVVPASAALARVGGANARLAGGQKPNLLGECALGENEQALVRGAAGRTVGEVATEGGSDFVTVVWALVELGVLTTLAATGAAREEPAHEPDPLDDEAIRQRVRARAALVREGDYFSLLGVARSATPYDIKRAYLELRRTFEPSRLLTARTVDLLDEVNLILEVVDEAYDILRDENRRERYRRAIEASPLV